MNATPDTPEEQLAEALELIKLKNARIAELEVRLRTTEENMVKFMRDGRF